MNTGEALPKSLRAAPTNRVGADALNVTDSMGHEDPSQGSDGRLHRRR